MLIIGNPKKDLIDNRVSIFNELMVSAYLYVMMTLSDYNEDLAQTSYYMNIALSTIVITSTGINLLKFIINTIMHIFKGSKDGTFIGRPRNMRLINSRTELMRTVKQK